MKRGTNCTLQQRKGLATCFSKGIYSHSPHSPHPLKLIHLNSTRLFIHLTHFPRSALLTHSYTSTHSLSHLLSHSPTPLTHSLTVTHSPTHPPYSLTHSLTLSRTHSPTHPPHALTYLLTHPLTLSLTYSLTLSRTHPPTHLTLPTHPTPPL